MQPADMSVAQLRIIRALLEGPAWAALPELVKALGYKAVERAELAPNGRGLEAVQDACCELELAGWLSTQERAEGLTVTLTPHAAEQLGVKLSLRRKTPRWVPRRGVEAPARLAFVPPDVIDQAAAEQRMWWSDEEPLVIHERHYRTGPHWIWLWTHEDCETGCSQHQIPAGQHCLYCGREGPRRDA